MLRSHYRVDMRLVAGSPEITRVRWYKAPPGAKYLGRTACASLVWDSQCDEPEGIGEVSQGHVWAKSYDERHYQGTCATGLPDWFINGIPPEFAYTYPECPTCALYTLGGGLILGGSGRSFVRQGDLGRGGLVLGGRGAQKASEADLGRGGLVLGGRGAQRWLVDQFGRGGLVLAGRGRDLGVNTQFGRGGLVLGGRGLQRWLTSDIGRGGLVLGGRGLQRASEADLGRGGLVLGGRGLQSWHVDQLGRGGLVLGGSSVSAEQPLKFCRVQQNAAQSFANVTRIAIQWDVTSYDPSHLHTGPDSSYFTAPLTGIYALACSFLTGTAYNEYNVIIYKNGVIQDLIQGENAAPEFQVSLPFPYFLKCAAGDTVQIGFWQNSGSAQSLYHDASNINNPWATFVFLGVEG